VSALTNARRGDGSNNGRIVEERAPVTTEAPAYGDRRAGRVGGRRRRALADASRGHVIRARHAGRFVADIALGTTIRAAAAQPWPSRDTDGPAVTIDARHVHQQVRVGPRSTTILFVVDASWSMAVARRLRAARGALFALLADAYTRRDRVGLITFRNRTAVVQLAPTGAIDAARRALAHLPVGGTTPLAAALVEAARVLRREELRHPGSDALMIILTDGAANVSLSGAGAPLEEAWRAADRLRRRGVRSVVIDAESRERDRGLAQTLARRLGASAPVLAELRADLLYAAARRAMELG
jgi:magnesium chelatase subunit D